MNMSGIARFRETVTEWMGVCLTIFLIVAVMTLQFQPMVQVAIFLSVSFSIVFMKKPIRGQEKDGPVWFAIDVFFSLIILAAGFYVWYDYLAMVYRAGAPTPLDNVVNIVGTLLTLEVARRVVGWPMIYVCVFFILYAFFGQYLFPPLSDGGYARLRVINMLFLSEMGFSGGPHQCHVQFHLPLHPLWRPLRSHGRNRVLYQSRQKSLRPHDRGARESRCGIERRHGHHLGKRRGKCRHHRHVHHSPNEEGGL